MRFTNEQILSHVDALIDRQQQNLDELKHSKPKKIKIRMDKAKDRISELRSFRDDLRLGLRPDPRMIEMISNDMKDLGW